MKILLVYPHFPDTFWGFRHVLKFISKKAAFPPLNLLTIAAMLPKTWQKELVDTNVSELQTADIDWADMVFISAMIAQKTSAIEIIKLCNQLGKKIVVGGPLFIAEPEKFEGVDHFILGEAEITLPLFLKDLKKGKPKHTYLSEIKPDISKTPIPLWPLIDINNYATLLVQYSRGCPFNCEFCDIVILNGRIPRTKTPKQLIKEMEAVYKTGWRGAVFIVDDNFIGNKVNVKKMLPGLISWQKKHGYPFKFLTEASINLADDTDLMKMMEEANFEKVFLGIETPNKISLDECGKRQNVAVDLVEAVKTIHRNGMQVMSGYIVGFDNDPDDIFETQIDFIQKTGVVIAMVGILAALPKTRLWHRLLKEGRLLGDSSGENTDGTINFIPRMDKQKLIEGYKKIIGSIYSKEQYFQRVNNLFADWKVNTKSGVLSWDSTLAFLKSIFWIGVVSNARVQYWKLFLKTLLTKRAAFPAAIELSIYYLHFDKLSKRIFEE